MHIDLAAGMERVEMMLPARDIDRRCPIPFYFQVRELLRARIRNGE